jgi:hypothetical protein
MKLAIPMNHFDERSLNSIGGRTEPSCENLPGITPVWDTGRGWQEAQRLSQNVFVRNGS